MDGVMRDLETLREIENKLDTYLPSLLELLERYSSNKKSRSFEHMMRQINYTIEHLEEQIKHEQ
jgi:hypothetical protein